MNNSTKDNLLEYLDETLNTQSSKLCGKMLKRFELIFPDNEPTDVKTSTCLKILKKELKEYVYESMRELRDLFYAYKFGLETTHFNFIKKEGK